MKSNRKIILSAMIASLTFIFTIVVKIPSPVGGYLNLGDAVVLLGGALLSPVYAFLAVAIGSAVADLSSGFLIYAPATFVIKGLMALCVSLIVKHSKTEFLKILSGVLAEFLMVGGYYIFEGFLYGFGVSMINIFPNVLQGLVGLIIGLILIRVFQKSKLIK